MAVTLVKRALESALRRALREFPAVVLTGARQSGKTTLLRSLLGRTHEYVSLEPPDIRASAIADPRGFLAFHPPPVLFDEVQYAAELLPYIKEWVDDHRDRPGQYAMSGSQNLLLMSRVTETLAGRAAMLRLMPLSRREIAGRGDAPFPWERSGAGKRVAVPAPRQLWSSLMRGGYPELAVHPKRDAGLWFSSYVQTYLERDVRALRQVGDLTEFQAFLRALAARSAQVLNLSSLSSDLGVALNTAKAWLSILEATHQVVVLRPYFESMGKRLVRRPKVFFTDVGLLCHLVGLRDPEHAAASPMNGAIFETAVFSEISKVLLSRGRDPQLYFWRTADGAEVDFLVETDGDLVPIEVKLSSTPKLEMARSIGQLRTVLGDRVRPGWIVHPGTLRLPLGSAARAVPFADL